MKKILLITAVVMASIVNPATALNKSQTEVSISNQYFASSDYTVLEVIGYKEKNCQGPHQNYPSPEAAEADGCKSYRMNLTYGICYATFWQNF
jgi:hypothetical protein